MGIKYTYLMKIEDFIVKVLHTQLRKQLRSLIGYIDAAIPQQPPSQLPFSFSLRTTTADEAFSIPLPAGFVYNASVDWGDGVVNTITSDTDPNKDHNYTTPGDYTVVIIGVMEGFGNSNWAYPFWPQVFAIHSMGDMGWSGAGLQYAFVQWEPVNQVTEANFQGDLSGVTDLTGFFGFIGNTENISVTVDFSKMLTTNCLNFTDFVAGFWANVGVVPITCDVSNLITPNTTNISGFTQYNDSAVDLTLIGLPTWDASGVTNCEGFVAGANYIAGWFADIATLDLPLVTSLRMFFNHIKGVTGVVKLPKISKNITDISFAFIFNSGQALPADVPDFAPLIGCPLVDISNSFGNFADIYGPVDLPIDQWDVSNVTLASNFLVNCILTTACYDRTLIAWATQAVQPNVTITFGLSTYTPGGVAEAARTSLINDHGWVIGDGGPVI